MRHGVESPPQNPATGSLNHAHQSIAYLRQHRPAGPAGRLGPPRFSRAGGGPRYKKPFRATYEKRRPPAYPATAEHPHPG